jgi:hypothetical protein
VGFIFSQPLLAWNRRTGRHQTNHSSEREFPLKGFENNAIGIAELDHLAESDTMVLSPLWRFAGLRRAGLFFAHL